MSERITVTRAQIGRAASIVGSVTLVIAVGLIVLQGEVTPLALAVLVVGMVGVVLWIALTPRDFQDRVTGRQARYGGNSLFGTLVFIGLALIVYGWVAAQDAAIDMTFVQNFTLSLQSREILDQMDRPVQLTGFYSSATQAQRDVDDVVFRLFADESGGRFRIVYYDPVLEPAQASRFGVLSDGVAVLTYVDPATNQPDLSRVEVVDLSGAQERAVANALLRLRAAGNFKVYFTTGHGEIDPQDTTRDGLSGLFARPNETGIQTAVLDLAQVAGEGIPADASAVLIAGARRRFTQAEADAIAAYLDGGGSLFVAADQPGTDNTFLDADDPLRAYLENDVGLRPLDAVLVDEEASFQNPFNIVSSALAVHAITEGLGDTLVVVFLGSRPIEVIPYENQPDSLGSSGRAPLVLTSETAYAETDLQTLASAGTTVQDNADPSGQMALAAVAQNIDTGARVLLAGDADFLRNEPAGYSGNLLFFDQALGWLTYYSDEVEIDPVSDFSRLPLALSDTALNGIFVGTVIVLPGLVLLVGLVVWNRRRGR